MAENKLTIGDDFTNLMDMLQGLIGEDPKPDTSKSASLVAKKGKPEEKSSDAEGVRKAFKGVLKQLETFASRPDMSAILGGSANAETPVGSMLKSLNEDDENGGVGIFEPKQPSEEDQTFMEALSNFGNRTEFNDKREADAAAMKANQRIPEMGDNSQGNVLGKMLRTRQGDAGQVVPQPKPDVPQAQATGAPQSLAPPTTPVEKPSWSNDPNMSRVITDIAESRARAGDEQANSFLDSIMEEVQATLANAGPSDPDIGRNNPNER